MAKVEEQRGKTKSAIKSAMFAHPCGQLRSVWAQGGTLDKASGPQPVPPMCRRRARDPVYGPLPPLAEGPAWLSRSGTTIKVRGMAPAVPTQDLD